MRVLKWMLENRVLGDREVSSWFIELSLVESPVPNPGQNFSNQECPLRGTRNYAARFEEKELNLVSTGRSNQYKAKTDRHICELECPFSNQCRLS